LTEALLCLKAAGEELNRAVAALARVAEAVCQGSEQEHLRETVDRLDALVVQLSKELRASRKSK